MALLALVDAGSFLLGLFVLSRLDLSLLTPLRQTKPVVVALIEPVVFATAFDPTVFLAATVAALGGAMAVYEWEGDGFVSLSLRDLGLIVVVMLVYTGLALGARFGTTSMPVLVYAGVTYGRLFAAYLGLFAGRWLSRRDSPPRLLAVRSSARGTVGPLSVPSLRASLRSVSRAGQRLASMSVPPRPWTALPSLLIAVALLDPLRSLAVWFAYGAAPSAASVTVLTQLTVPLQVVVGGVALDERHTTKRLVAGLLVVAGVVSLVAV